MEADVFRATDIREFVVEEETFVGSDTEGFAGKGVDDGVGLGDAEFTGPGEVVEVGEPGKFLAHGAQDIGTHVGENGGEEAGILESGGPVEHGLDEVAGPHKDVIFDESVDFLGGEVESSVTGEFVPVAAAIEDAEVVVVAVAPVETLEGFVVEAGECEELAVSGGVGGAQDLAVVEDDGAHKDRVQGAGYREQGFGLAIDPKVRRRTL